MNPLIYTGVIFAGAATLLIEAWKNYEQSLGTTPFDEYPILKGVQVSKLCTRRERNIGFIFYSLLYLLAYAIVLASAELYELLQQTARANQEIGPTQGIVGLGGQQSDIIDGQYGKPIFVSAAIISLFSVGALKPVETTMRSLAHRLAGVPRGVYAVIEDLHSLPYETFKYGEPTPFWTRFQTNFAGAFDEKADADQLATLKRALHGIDYLAPTMTGHTRTLHFPMIQLAKLRDLSSQLEKDLKSLRSDLGHPPGEEGNPDVTKRDEVASRIKQTHNDCIALLAVHFLRNNRAMKQIVPGEAESRRKTTRKRVPPVKSAVERIYREIKRGYRVEHNSFSMSLLAAAILGMILCYSIYFEWNSKEYRLRPGSVAPQVVSTLEQWGIHEAEEGQFEEIEEAVQNIMEMLGTDIEEEGRFDDFYAKCTAAAPQKLEYVDPWQEAAVGKSTQAGIVLARLGQMLIAPPRFDRPGDIEVAEASGSGGSSGGYGPVRSFADTDPICMAAWESALVISRDMRRQSLHYGSFWVVFPVLLAVGFAAITAIFGREVRHEDNSWPSDWSLRQIPFLRLFNMSVIPALAAVMGITVGLMLQLLADSGLGVTQNAVVYLFDYNKSFIAMHLGVGFIVSMSVLILIDQHDALYNESTVLISLILAFALVTYYFLVVYVGYPPVSSRPSPEGVWLNMSFQTREALLHAAPGACFLLAFGCFLEVTEDPRRDKGWMVIAIWPAMYSFLVGIPRFLRGGGRE